MEGSEKSIGAIPSWWLGNYPIAENAAFPGAFPRLIVDPVTFSGTIAPAEAAEELLGDRRRDVVAHAGDSSRCSRPSRTA